MRLVISVGITLTYTLTSQILQGIDWIGHSRGLLLLAARNSAQLSWFFICKKLFLIN